MSRVTDSTGMGPPDAQEHRGLERIPVRVFPDRLVLSRHVARRMAELVRSRQRAGRRAVLGLATGSTPLGVYQELVRLHRDEELDLSNVVTFNLDEYFPMQPDSRHSYRRYMREHLFDHVNIPPDQVHVPRGDIPRDQVEGHCRAYEAAVHEAGGIDLQILGIGRSGHIGFNEPGTARQARTRLVRLAPVTRADAASEFSDGAHVPLEAVTMGVGTILEAREIALLAIGAHKAEVVRRAVEGDVHPDVPASYLQGHTSTVVCLDPAAASGLARGPSQAG